MRESRFRPPAVGGSSLLVIFAVLCLTVFALLSLSTVQAGNRLSQITKENVAAYYDADTMAEEIFARLRAGEMPAGVTPCGCDAEGYRYVCPVSDTQQLTVELHREEDKWTVRQWRTESVVDWQQDESLQVWDGTET